MRVRTWAPLLLFAALACGRHRAAAVPEPLQSPAATADSIWRLAQREYDRGHWMRAQRLFDRLTVVITPGDPRYLRMHFYQGELFLVLGSQLQAVREFRRVADEQPDGPLAADALVRAGDAYADLWRRSELDPTYGETARTVYDEVQSRYGGTPAAARAALRLTQLGEKFAKKELANAVFYFRYKAYDSAILLLRALIATYPRSSAVPEALQRLVRTYQILGYQEDVKETCAYITQYHPGEAGLVKLCKPALAQGAVGGGAPAKPDTLGRP